MSQHPHLSARTVSFHWRKLLLHFQRVSVVQTFWQTRVFRCFDVDESAPINCYLKYDFYSKLYFALLIHTKFAKEEVNLVKFLGLLTGMRMLWITFAIIDFQPKCPKNQGRSMLALAARTVQIQVEIRMIPSCQMTDSRRSQRHLPPTRAGAIPRLTQISPSRRRK